MADSKLIRRLLITGAAGYLGRSLCEVLAADYELLRMDLEMIVPTAIDWDRDGDVDLIVGDEDGRVAFIEHSGQVVDSLPQFFAPVYFQQEADNLKFGALVTPFTFDWDDDGDQDLICGNTAGYIGFTLDLPFREADEAFLRNGEKVRGNYRTPELV